MTKQKSDECRGFSNPKFTSYSTSDETVDQDIRNNTGLFSVKPRKKFVMYRTIKILL